MKESFVVQDAYVFKTSLFFSGNDFIVYDSHGQIVFRLDKEKKDDQTCPIGRPLPHSFPPPRSSPSSLPMSRPLSLISFRSFIVPLHDFSYNKQET
ncbi:hypothetical protein K1719_002028 [Acacia pycnantha]|nr:hypothetical protein K1719_002028 [Acacia pycnantha]